MTSGFYAYSDEQLTLPCKREGLHRNVHRSAIPKSPDMFKHPKATSIINLFRLMNFDKKLPLLLKKSIYDKPAHFKQCSENAWLLRTPKPAILQLFTSKFTVTLDLQNRNICNKQQHIVVFLDNGENMMRPCALEYDIAKTSSQKYFSRCISIFHASV